MAHPAFNILFELRFVAPADIIQSHLIGLHRSFVVLLSVGFHSQFLKCRPHLHEAPGRVLISHLSPLFPHVVIYLGCNYLDLDLLPIVRSRDRFQQQLVDHVRPG